MLFYKNNSMTAKTFHGVTFQPGEIKESPGYINDPKFQRIFSMPQEPPKSVEVKEESKKESVKHKKEESHSESKAESSKSSKKFTIKEKQEENLDGTDSDK